MRICYGRRPQQMTVQRVGLDGVWCDMQNSVDVTVGHKPLQYNGGYTDVQLRIEKILEVESSISIEDSTSNIFSIRSCSLEGSSLMVLSSVVSTQHTIYSDT